MKKINIKDLQVDIDIIQVLDLYSVKKNFFIDINGNILENIDDNVKNPIIFKTNDNTFLINSNDAKELSLEIFKDYKPTIIGTKCRIKPLSKWQDIIDLNKELMLYFDHQSDGVEFFEDKILEDYGWNASALEINYRQISDFIEENCEGILLCYDNEVQFNGFTIVEDINDVRLKVKEFIKTQAKINIDKDIVDLDDEDVIDALELFELKV